jgi:translation initiation factor IF-3
VVNFFDALNKAKEAGLDLVEIVPKADPVVVKVMDYGKFLYIKKKQERKTSHKSRGNETKEIRLGIKTDTHDLNVKQKRALKFLKEGYKVGVEIKLKGRERIFLDNARTKLQNFIKELGAGLEFEQIVKKSPMGFNAIIKKGKE